MTHELVFRYRRLVKRCDAILARARIADDQATIARAADNAKSAREALSAMERDAGAIQWVGSLKETS